MFISIPQPFADHYKPDLRIQSDYRLVYTRKTHYNAPILRLNITDNKLFIFVLKLNTRQIRAK